MTFEIGTLLAKTIESAVWIVAVAWIIATFIRCLE